MHKKGLVARPEVEGSLGGADRALPIRECIGGFFVRYRSAAPRSVPS